MGIRGDTNLRNHTQSKELETPSVKGIKYKMSSAPTLGRLDYIQFLYKAVPQKLLQGKKTDSITIKTLKDVT